MLTTDYVTGSPNWIDLASPDVGATAAFYGGVFGWDLQSAGPEAQDYGFFTKDGHTVAALGPLTEDGARSAWTMYFQTPDASTTAKAVEQGGGTVRVEPMDVFDNGRLAAFTDPGGAEFAVWQPAATKGLEAVTDPNTLCWAELHTVDPAAALAFYRSLFQWRTEEMPMPGMTYTVLSTAEDEQAFGGVVPLQEGQEPRWLPYFEVADADAVVTKTQQAGGSVLMPATDAPDIGRMAWLADPFGAPFAIIKGAAVPSS